MGLLNKLFGGGTKLELTLDAGQVPVGGLLSGRVTLHGGKKALTLSALNVRLVYILVRSKEGSSLPEIDTRVLIDQALVTNRDLPADAVQTFEFRFNLPEGLAASGEGVTYKVMAAADIPKVTDPTAEATLTVVEGGHGGEASLDLDEVHERFPGLQSGDEDEVVEALREVHLACYSERETLQVLEPILAGFIRTGSSAVRTQALEAWANLLDGFARKEHLKLLGDLLAAPTFDRSFMRELIVAACKFADEGGLPLVQNLARSQDPEIREEVAQQLRFAAADKFRGKLDLLQAMAGDSVAAVRAAVISAYGDYRDNKKLMAWVAEQFGKDPSPVVQAACLDTLALLHHHGQGDLTLQIFERALTNKSSEVRRKLSENLQWLPHEALPRVRALAERLLADPDAAVRKSMAWYFINLRDFPELAPLILHCAENDPDPVVRKEALTGMSSVVPVGELCAHYRAALAADPSEDVAWAVLSGSRDHVGTPEGRALLQDLARSGWGDVAQEAQSTLENAD